MTLTTVGAALGRGPYTPATLSTAQKVVELYLQHDCDYMLMSGRWSVFEPIDYDLTESALGVMLALDLNVPASAILCDDDSLDTASNHTCSRVVIRNARITLTKLVIVTIPYAAPRARFLARKVYGSEIQIESVVSDYRFSGFRERFRVFRQEALYLALMRISLLGVRNGDIAAIQRRLELWHPGYNAKKVRTPIVLTS